MTPYEREGNAVPDQVRDSSIGEEVLWQRVYEISCRVARAQFRLSIADSEEIGQEMLLRALRQSRRAASINVAWICQGARFACIDRVRARRAEEQALMRYGNESRSPVSFSPAAISADDLRIALRGLPRHCQELIQHYYFEGLTWAELDQALARGCRSAQYETGKCIEQLSRALYKR